MKPQEIWDMVSSIALEWGTTDDPAVAALLSTLRERLGECDYCDDQHDLSDGWLCPDCCKRLDSMGLM